MYQRCGVVRVHSNEEERKCKVLSSLYLESELKAPHVACDAYVICQALAYQDECYCMVPESCNLPSFAAENTTFNAAFNSTTTKKERQSAS
jgi:hypothetical protein